MEDLGKFLHMKNVYGGFPNRKHSILVLNLNEYKRQLRRRCKVRHQQVRRMKRDSTGTRLVTVTRFFLLITFDFRSFLCSLSICNHSANTNNWCWMIKCFPFFFSLTDHLLGPISLISAKSQNILLLEPPVSEWLNIMFS